MTPWGQNMNEYCTKLGSMVICLICSKSQLDDDLMGSTMDESFTKLVSVVICLFFTAHVL
jgi:hypothetical protein